MLILHLYCVSNIGGAATVWQMLRQAWLGRFGCIWLLVSARGLVFLEFSIFISVLRPSLALYLPRGSIADCVSATTRPAWLLDGDVQESQVSVGFQTAEPARYGV